MRKFTAILALILAAAIAQAQTKSNQLQVFFIDVEGGQSTLFITPAGKSLLIDTGWSGNNGRDADRIAAIAKSAGLTKIDYVLITHYHVDHVGGVPQLLQRIPVGVFFDHGENRELTPQVTGDYNNYKEALASAHVNRVTAKPGDVLPIQGMRVQVISADGNLIDKPLPGAGQPNPYCAASETRPADQTENARSLGTLITFGKLRILDLGDLTWDKEMQLMCPNNKLGHVDILVVSHHGWMQSSSPALVDAIGARVAIMDNGEKKGGSTPDPRHHPQSPRPRNAVAAAFLRRRRRRTQHRRGIHRQSLRRDRPRQLPQADRQPRRAASPSSTRALNRQ